jgi:asparagine synthase (glutamine-hydrolysing)
MSGIVGFYRLDGAPADPALLRAMTDAAADRGPDGGDCWVDGPIGLGHRLLRSTPESLQDKQPLGDETGDRCLVLDGRVDNRDELRRALAAAGLRLRSDSDAELVLRAYERWGTHCPARIIGDFAFALWDGRERLLFCARDPLGVRPFYYHADARGFSFASELRQILVDPCLSAEPNEGMIAEYLACEVTDRAETLYRGILRLPPAHSMVVRRDRLALTRYWEIDPGRAIRCGSDRDYAEHFSAVFGEAVRCRLRSAAAVGAELSGGLDSSSVVAMIGPGLETFSLTFPDRSCDESVYASQVVTRHGLKATAVDPAQYELDWRLAHARHSRDFPEYPTCTMSDSLKRIARAQGIRVLLTGYGGDDWLGGSPYHYADLLRRLELGRFLRQVISDHAAGLIERRLFSALHYGAWPLLPRWARRTAKLIWSPRLGPDWLDPGFVARTGLRDRLRRAPVAAPNPTFAQDDLNRLLDGGWHAHGMEMLDRSAARAGLELRHPFHDRRVVEFALALPESQRRRGSTSKFILREAMRGRLPESVRQRRDKADFSHVFAEALCSPGARHILQSPVTAAVGWVRGEAARRACERMSAAYAAGDPGYAAQVRPLWMLFGIEIWLGAALGRGAD